MKRPLLFTACFFIAVIAHSQQLWNEENADSQRDYLNRNSSTLPDQVKFYTLNVSLLQDKMRSAGSFDAGATAVRLEIPLPDGSLLPVDVFESSIMPPQLQAIIPDVRTYVLVDPVTKSSLGRITIHNNNITGLIFSGKGNVFINPVDPGNSRVHITYYTKEVHYPVPVACGVTDEAPATGTGNTNGRVYAGDCHLRSYRLAVAATGEYYWWANSPPVVTPSVANALSYIAITVNTVNAIYERDATIHFNLVPNNNLIIYTDSLTDPYPTLPFPNGGTLNNNNSFTNTALGGAANYDIGIVFSKQWNGGLAQLSSVCGVSHGRAAAGLDFGSGPNPTPGPQGPVFDGTAAHEMGHQFSATHTMVANNGQCGPNVTLSSAWEPGGGSTLMAYAGTCSPNFYQFNSDLYFHVGNVDQISTFATSVSGGCATNTVLSNVAPTVSVAAASYVIPVSTPFMLTCSAGDLNGNSLTYTWEEMDTALVSTGATPSPAATKGPNFRSFPPSSNATRYFPNLPSVLTGLTQPYERLPSVTRTMHFTVNVRDNAAGGGCNAQEDVDVNTNATAGPFSVTSQSTPTSLTADGISTFTITWNVAGSDVAPVNCANVDILFSADGGQNFNYTLLANTPNDGTQTIAVPNIVTSSGRVMVKAVGNIFFNVNAANITIASGCGAEGATLAPSATVNASPGANMLNLSSAPSFGSVLLPLSGSLQASDPASTLALFNTTTSSCINFSNQYKYDVYPFRVNVAGSYTFSQTGGTYDVNVYSGTFNPASPCTNFMNSSIGYNGGVFFQPLTVNLIPGVLYNLTVGTFDASNPSPLPFAYTISLASGPGGGNVYSGYPNPGGAFSYRYVIVNNATGNIVAISTTPDLRTFPAGNYTVYGFSFLTANFDASSLNSYVNGPFTTLANDLLNNPSTRCGNLSKNSVAVSIFMVLPVKLLPLTAVWDNQDVKLYWSTAQETGSKNFEIERSGDGQNFTFLKSIPAAINSD
ncbi:MAG TPA: zinc-dependent metalloprotease family protein, partial [Chitinophagaceae bacterium]|nr:zinc-dependent metalloprotease family protein [Chitinophagaceae bacterium]